MVEERTEIAFKDVLLARSLLHVGIVALPAISLPASLASYIEETCPWNLIESLAGDTDDRPGKFLSIASIGFRIFNLHTGMSGLLTMLDFLLLLADNALVISGTLLESGPDGCVFRDRS